MPGYQMAEEYPEALHREDPEDRRLKDRRLLLPMDRGDHPQADRKDHLQDDRRDRPSHLPGSRPAMVGSALPRKEQVD